VGGLTAVAAALRFYGLGHQGFWFDEGNTVLLVHLSPGKMLGLIPQTESTPPLYYCVAWVWARVFGFSEAGLRSLSAVAGTLAVPVAYVATAKLVSRRAGLLVAALTASNPFLIWYSQEARSYSLLVLFCALTLATFAYALERPTARRVTAWALCCALGLATHYYAVVVVAPQAAWLLYRHWRKRTIQAALGAALACGLALIPLALSQSSTGRDSWIAHSDLGVRLRQIIPQFLIGTGAPARSELKFAAMALALVGLGTLAWRVWRPAQGGDAPAEAGDARAPAEAGDARAVRGAALAGGLALAGFLLSLAFVAAGSDTLITRNIIGLWLPAAVAVGGGLALARPRALGLAAAGALCGIGLTAAIGVATDYSLQRPDWRVVARTLGPGPPPGSTRLILIQHYRTLLPLSLYLHGLRFLRGPAASGVRELDVIAISSPQQPLCWWGAACNLIPSQLQSRYDVPGFSRLWVRSVRQFTIMRLVAARAERVTVGEVSRTLHTTTLAHDELLIQH
jgi:mannosyltransferase